MEGDQIGKWRSAGLRTGYEVIAPRKLVLATPAANAQQLLRKPLAQHRRQAPGRQAAEEHVET
jgi:hypothetical protein